MLTRPQLEEQFRCTYPDNVSSETKKRRLKDITALQSMIAAAKADNALSYGGTEERLVIFTTKQNEQVAIQYPGKESVNTNPDKVCPYDFRPKIILEDGTVVKDMAFFDMWSVVESMAAGYRDFIRLLSAVFFKMGRMLIHSDVTKQYSYSVLSATGEVLGTGSRELSWFQLELDEEILQSLQFHIPEITLDDGTVISFEAFVYFFEMLLQNEDSKYYYKKHNLSSGRIPTSDSMLLLVSYYLGSTSLATLLQRYVSGFGVAKCNTYEIPNATGGLIQIVNPKEKVLEYLDNLGLVYRISATRRIAGRSISMSIAIDSKKVAVVSEYDEERMHILADNGWNAFLLEDLVNTEVFARFCAAIAD